MTLGESPPFCQANADRSNGDMANSGNLFSSARPGTNQELAVASDGVAARAYSIWSSRLQALDAAESDWQLAETQIASESTARDEIRGLADQVEELILRLKAANSRLAESHTERCRAGDLQHSFLPNVTRRWSRFEIGGRTQPCDIVGGDFFDCISLGERKPNRLGVLVVDSCGHSIHSAMLSAEVRGYIRGLSTKCGDLARILDLTETLLRGAPGPSDFVTAFFLELSTDNRTLSYIGAGHPPAHIIDQSGQVRAVLHSIGPPLGIGIHKPRPFCPSTVAIKPGDLILLNTDGVTEAMSPAGELFGSDRMLRCITEHRRKNPDQILDCLFDTLADFCQGVSRDDTTAVVIKVDIANPAGTSASEPGWCSRDRSKTA
jgi:serine phosphatase RsbU (regulator of sigma subunit)